MPVLASLTHRKWLKAGVWLVEKHVKDGDLERQRVPVMEVVQFQSIISRSIIIIHDGPPTDPTHPPPVPISAPPPNSSTDTEPPNLSNLSKNLQKRALKAASLASKKLERRACKKENKKLGKVLKHTAGEIDSDKDEENELKKRNNRKRIKLDEANWLGVRVVVDLGFDELMNDKVRFATTIWYYI